MLPVAGITALMPPILAVRELGIAANAEAILRAAYCKGGNTSSARGLDVQAGQPSTGEVVSSLITLETSALVSALFRVYYQYSGQQGVNVNVNSAVG